MRGKVSIMFARKAAGAMSAALGSPTPPMRMGIIHCLSFRSSNPISNLSLAVSSMSSSNLRVAVRMSAGDGEREAGIAQAAAHEAELSLGVVDHRHHSERFCDLGHSLV